MFRATPNSRGRKRTSQSPAEFKRVIDEKYGTQFYITSLDGRVAQIYLRGMGADRQKLANLSTFNSPKKKFSASALTVHLEPLARSIHPAEKHFFFVGLKVTDWLASFDPLPFLEGIYLGNPSIQTRDIELRSVLFRRSPLEFGGDLRLLFRPRELGDCRET